MIHQYPFRIGKSYHDGSRRQIVDPSMGLLHPNVRKRRLTTTSEEKVGKSSTVTTTKQKELEKLEGYTERMLRSTVVPWGTFRPTDWDNTIHAFVKWTETPFSNSGYGITSAESILKRLKYELLTLRRKNPLFVQRKIQIEELTWTLLRSWMELHRKNPMSIISLERSEAVLFSLLLEKNTLFPIEEYLEILDGWLGLQSSYGSERAALLFLQSTTGTKFDHLNLSRHASQLGQRLDRIILSVIEHVKRDKAIDLNTQILERLETLSWKDWVISETTLHAMDELVFQRLMKESSDMPIPSSNVRKTITVSPFEAEAMQKRMVHMFQTGGIENQEDMTKVLNRIKTMEHPSDELIKAMVDFFIRIGDVSNASIWILHLSPDYMFANNSSIPHHSIVDQLLEAWSKEESHPQVPWRAEEVFRQILNRQEEGTVLVSTQTMNQILKIWNQSSDPSAKRKIREWFSQTTETMNLKPDESSIYYALTAIDTNTPQSEVLFEHVFRVWDDWNQNEKQHITDLLLDVLWKAPILPKVAIELLARIKADDSVLVPRDRFLLLLHRAFSQHNPPDVPRLIETVSERLGMLDLTFHEAAIYVLIKDRRDHITTAESVWRSALQQAAVSNPASEDLATFLTSVTKIYTNNEKKLYDEAETLLIAAEELLLPTVGHNSQGMEFPVPMDAYKLLIVRNWYRAQTATKVIEVCKRVRALYGQGYINLLPDQDFYLAYLKAMSVVSQNPSELIEIFDDIVQIYEEDRSKYKCKPNADIVNTILMSIKSNVKDPKEAWQQSLNLSRRMKSLDTIPDAKTLNLLMQNAIKGENQRLVYTVVVGLYNQFEQFTLEPDSRTFHSVVSACGYAKEEDKESALNLGLQMFGEIRKRGETTVFTYASLTKSLRRLLRKGPLADKVVTSTLQLCYQDGLLAPEVRQAYQSMATDTTWKEIYAKKLTEGKEEPFDWHRHLPSTAN